MLARARVHQPLQDIQGREETLRGHSSQVDKVGEHKHHSLAERRERDEEGIRQTEPRDDRVLREDPQGDSPPIILPSDQEQARQEHSHHRLEELEPGADGEQQEHPGLRGSHHEGEEEDRAGVHRAQITDIRAVQAGESICAVLAE